MSSVPPGHLARALSSLQEVRLESTYVTEEQVACATTCTSLQASSLMVALAGASSLRVLDLGQNRLAGLPDLPFSMVVSRIPELNLANCRLSGGQARALFGQLSESSAVTSFKVSDNDLSSVPANIFAKAANSMAEVDLSNCCLSIYQVGPHHLGQLATPRASTCSP